MESKTKNTGGLSSRFSSLGIWAFSIGASIGWGSFIVTCNTYLQKSGILGTVFGLLIGMAVIFVITWNLQHMIRVSPDAGGIYTFQKRIGGSDLGFLAFWFILLTYLAVLWANITSVPLFARFFLGNTFRFGFHYQIFGYDVWLGEALLSIAAVVLVGLLCAKSSKIPVRIMTGAAILFAAGFAVCSILAVAGHKDIFSFSPLYTEGSNAFLQIVRIAAISPWAFIGFENVSHFSEEYSFPVKKVRRILIWSVIITTLLYLFVSLLSVSAYPAEYGSWLEYIQDMGNLEGIKAVPAFYAANYYLGNTGVIILMLSLFAVILTSLIANMMALSRLLYAAGREGDAHKSFGKLSDKGIPDKAIYVIAAVSLIIPFLGRTAIGWIVDVTTLGATIIYFLISQAVFVSARRDKQRTETITGVAGMVLMVVFMLFLLIPGLLPFDTMATESYALFIVWSIIGLAYFRHLKRKDTSRSYGNRNVVWIILLMLIIFASMMWVSMSTEKAANEAVQRIYEYHQSHPEHDTDETQIHEREDFLQEQADAVSSTNILYSIASLGIFLLCIGILFSISRENRQLGERLTAAEEATRAAQKIAELKVSIGVLLDNMPALSFYKDAETGVYLACNQAFAEYAHKDSPEGVVGLTDFEIFDETTAAHFVEDDKMALAMDEPYVFYEDVADAQGNPRQFRTTKLKFYDTNGRMCLLGMGMDVTEMETFRREKEQTQAAYREAVSAGERLENIVDALSDDYFEIYYINLVTGEYTEFGSKTEMGGRNMEKRGTDFFDTCMRDDSMQHIYEEDRESFKASMQRDTVLRSIESYGTYIIQYRKMIDNVPTYVSLKATGIQGDDAHLIVGISNIDAQTRDRIAAQQAREDRKTYQRLSALNGNLIVLCYVDPETENYTVFSSTGESEKLGISAQGQHFFDALYEKSAATVHTDDIEKFRTVVTKENIMQTIDKDSVFAFDYRLMTGDMATYVRLKAAKIVENGKTMLIIGLLDEDAQIRLELEYEQKLAIARNMANRDALTGVRNKYAYVDAEKELNDSIYRQEKPQFALVIFDVNNLKLVNDTLGHREGDRYIRKACAAICNVFKRSPVYRVGGDEFLVICKGYDYEHIETLMQAMEEFNKASAATGEVQIACGMARFGDTDRSVGTVFERADRCMYENKAKMKE